MDLPETIKYPEAVERYQCSRRTLEYAVAAGAIEAYKPGAAVLIVIESADKWFCSTKLKPKARRGRPRNNSRSAPAPEDSQTKILTQGVDMEKILGRLDRIEKMLEQFVTSGGRPTVMPDAVATAILGGPDALLEYNKRERAAKLRKKKQKS